MRQISNMRARLCCIFFFIFVCNFQRNFAGRVLFLPPMISPSHKIPMKAWSDLLAKRNHEIFWWAPVTKLDKYQPEPSDKVHVEQFEVKVEDPILMGIFRYGNHSIQDIYWSSEFINPATETEFAHIVMPFCLSVIENHRESFREITSRTYDLVVVDDILNPCGWAVSQMVVGPVAVFITSSGKTRIATKFNGLPVQYAVTPTLSDLQLPTDLMNFRERTRTALRWSYAYVADYFYYKSMTKSLQTLLPYAAGIETGVLRPHLQFHSMSPFFDLVSPTSPNMVNVGGLQVPKRGALKPLTQDFKTWINKNDLEGFVVLSFGHWVNWTTAPTVVKTAFIEVFSNISNKFSVIWQYDGPAVQDLPENVHLVKWLPLTTLLSEPKCKLFITHCGCNSLTEASTYGVPMLAIPLWADQPDGAARIVRKGVGVLLKKTSITTDTLSRAIMEVLSNESYTKNVQKFSKQQSELLMNAEETTIFWSEFLMRNYGKNDGVYYRTSKSAMNMNWLQFYSLDVILFFGCIFILFCIFIVKILSLFLNK